VSLTAAEWETVVAKTRHYAALLGKG